MTKRPLTPEFIDLLTDLAHKAGCDWYQDNEGRCVIYQDNDDMSRASIDDSKNMKAHVDQVLMCCNCHVDHLALTIYNGNALCSDCYHLVREEEKKQLMATPTKGGHIDEEKFKDLLAQCDYEQRQIIQRFTRLMIDSGIHGTRFGLTVIGAGHEGDHALVSLKVDVFNTEDQYVNFNQKQLNMMKAYKLKMVKLEAPDSSPYFYIHLLDDTEHIKPLGTTEART